MISPIAIRRCATWLSPTCRNLGGRRAANAKHKSVCSQSAVAADEFGIFDSSSPGDAEAPFSLAPAAAAWHIAGIRNAAAT